ncbi:MAG: hypothetical protein ACOYYU_01075 [Chloroflexota bacterium]
MTTDKQAKTAPLFRWIFFWLGVLLLFSIVHFTDKRAAQALDALSALPLLGASKKEAVGYLEAVKGWLFLFSTALISLPILRDACPNLRRSKPADAVQALLIALGIALLLACLSCSPGNQAMGARYAEISEHPFTQGNSRYSARLFMPAMAYILFFRGNWLYYLFFLGLTVGLIALLLHWNKASGGLNAWQCLSLCTSSFVLFQFQSPGYPDVLVFIFFLLVMCDAFGEDAKLSLLILALVTHEASLLVGAVLAWRYLSRGRFIAYISSLVVYTGIGLIATGFHLEALNRYSVSDMSGIEWVLHAPLKELLGVFIAFKALWAVIFSGIALGIRHKLHGETKFIIFTTLAGLVMTCLAIDTSRMMGFAFPGLLAALSVIRQTLPRRTIQWFYVFIFLLNIVLPSFSVELNAQIGFAPGLYQRIYAWLVPLLANALSSR